MPEVLTAEELPPVALPTQVAAVLQTSPAALANDRYLGRGVPFIRMGRRIRYLRSDVLKFLEDNRSAPAAS